MHVRFRPLSDWDGPRTNAFRRRQRPFSASWPVTLAQVQRELEYLDAKEVVIEAAFRESDIRVDGWPRANATNPLDPGVRLAFDSKHGPLIYQCDTCEEWQHNMRSIGLGLAALRAVDRYGVTHRGQQYTGWKAITAKAASSAPWDEIQRLAGAEPGATFARPTLVRWAKRRTHPDNLETGSTDDWETLTALLAQVDWQR